jgi:hypothetical protein
MRGWVVSAAAAAASAAGGDRSGRLASVDAPDSEFINRFAVFAPVVRVGSFRG